MLSFSLISRQKFPGGVSVVRNSLWRHLLKGQLTSDRLVRSDMLELWVRENSSCMTHIKVCGLS